MWLAEKETISKEAIAALNDAVDNGTPVFVSVISSWEIGMLVALKRLPLSMAPLAWFEHLLAIPGVQMAEISPRILIASSSLPGRPPKDPMDRIILATARESAYRIMTRDKELLKYAEQGHVYAIAC